MAFGVERGAMKDAWVEVAVGLFFTTSPLSKLLFGAQREYYTPCLLIHISHILVWIERGGRWKREAKTRRRRERGRDLIQAGGHQRWRKNEAGMLSRGTHNSTKRKLTYTHTDKHIIRTISPILYACTICALHQPIAFIFCICVYILVGRVPHWLPHFGKMRSGNWTYPPMNSLKLHWR